MKRFVCSSVLAVATALILGGCGKSDSSSTPVNAREKRVLPGTSPKAEVTRWKQTGAKDKTYGLVVEQENSKVTANLYALEAGEGLVIREREAQGKFFPDLKALVFPLYNPPTITAEQWVKDGGPHIVVPWSPQSTNLIGTLQQPGQSNTFTFVKLEGVAPTYPAGATAK